MTPSDEPTDQIAEPFASFSEVAPYYDRLMRPMPYRMWVGYLLLLLSTVGAEAQKVLEIGCGTGTLCQLLAEEGFDLTGLDLSPAMIHEAQQKLERWPKREECSPIAYLVADASDFTLPDQFDAVFSFFDSLNNITDPERLQSAFRCIAACLRPGGAFIFDLNTPFAFEENLFDQRQTSKNAKLKYRWEGNYSPETQIIEVTMDFWHEDKSFREVHRQRAYGPDEIIPMLEAAGLIFMKAYNSYGLEPPRKSSDRIHYVALKPS